MLRLLQVEHVVLLPGEEAPSSLLVKTAIKMRPFCVDEASLNTNELYLLSMAKSWKFEHTLLWLPYILSYVAKRKIYFVHVFSHFQFCSPMEIRNFQNICFAVNPEMGWNARDQRPLEIDWIATERFSSFVRYSLYSWYWRFLISNEFSSFLLLKILNLLLTLWLHELRLNFYYCYQFFHET